MSEIRVENLAKSFGGANVIDDVSFTVPPGAILVILGPSGCGKTTTLRCIAGLERPTAGSIVIDGKTMVDDHVDLPPEHRHLGMVFQSYALWPHKTVAQNISYGLGRMRPEQVREKVRDSLSLVGLEGLEDRYPSTLSGGQQQRVALARSAAAGPKVMLLDEPLSNLDAKLREQMRVELRHLIKSLNTTAIYITHDQSEAMALADKVIFMKDGKVHQEAPPRVIYKRPATRSVAEFVGSATFLPAKVVSGAGGASAVELGSGTVLATKVDLPVGKEVTVVIRPERIRLYPGPMDAENQFVGKVTDFVFLGESTEYTVKLGPHALTSRSHRDFAIGDDVHLVIAPEDVILLPAD
jgi:ABC-type Fe3+/spermidine/putrescine transport system ATPase subunit